MLRVLWRWHLVDAMNIGWMRAVPSVLFKTYGNLTWDGVVRGSGAVSLLGIALMLLLPAAGPLAAFMLITIWLNGPLAPFFPASYEPILMLFGRVYSPLLIGSLGMMGTIYVEFLNYHLYRRLLDTKALSPLSQSAVVKRIVGWYKMAPFFTIWLCSWSPLPYWSVRFLSPLAGYDVRRHLSATFLGRFPRLWFFAALGLWWNVSIEVLLVVTFGSIALAATVYCYKMWRVKPQNATT
jgi:uncharacterized membrane protein YdjX (TVP38/TMEM64 family)